MAEVAPPDEEVLAGSNYRSSEKGLD